MTTTLDHQSNHWYTISEAITEHRQDAIKSTGLDRYEAWNHRYPELGQTPATIAAAVIIELPASGDTGETWPWDEMKTPAQVASCNAAARRSLSEASILIHLSICQMHDKSSRK